LNLPVQVTNVGGLAESPLPESVRKFIVRHIHTLEQLDILLLLLENPRAWSDQEIAAALRTAPESARARLSRLHGDGLVAISPDAAPKYLYKPRTEALDREARALAQCYREKRVAVITQIFAPGGGRATLFADAFRIKKGEG
jgi:predicted ArsR family transcriptional regulator